jgi:RNA polymerase sigma-70 factor (ECF subfamily)
MSANVETSPADRTKSLVRSARDGDRKAFEALCESALPKLRSVVRKMVGVPAQTDDIVQDALTKAWTSLGGFDGRAEFSTWLCRIGSNLAIDFLRSQKRWRDRAQVAYGNECAASPELGGEVGEVLTSPDFRYDAREHIAFCFVCVARSLDPELAAALVLRDVEELTNQEAAHALGVSESVLRHRLAEARQTMERSFDGLCALVNKNGVCYQCSGLRESVPDTERRGEPPPDVTSFDKRLRVVRDANVDCGRSQAMHDVFWRRLALQEEAGVGSTEPRSGCGLPKPPSA